MEVLKVAVVQPNLIWHNYSANLKSIQEQMSVLDKADLIVLPEMWSSGFTMKAHQFYTYTSDALGHMKSWSLKFDAAVIGSLITKVDEKYFNRSYIILNGEVLSFYDKVHLFGFSGEDRFFQKGSEKCIVNVKGWNCCVNICYDLRFPVWSRNIDNYDLLIFSANWPQKRIDAWDTLLKARAIENQAYVLGANCVGEDAWHNQYLGHSAIIQYDGTHLQQLKDVPGILLADFNKSELKSFRSSFPFLEDRDDFVLV